MKDLLFNSWPWYVSGPLIAFVMYLLLKMGKSFGMSSNLRTFCSMCGAGKSCSFFNFDWKANRWNLWVVLGTILGGVIASQFLVEDAAVQITEATVNKLQMLGFSDAGTAYLPESLFSLSSLNSFKTWAILVAGGFMVGFGARYAGGCTSGHAISGLSNLQLPSLIAVIGFFAGGLLMVHYLFPILF